MNLDAKRNALNGAYTGRGYKKSTIFFSGCNLVQHTNPLQWGAGALPVRALPVTLALLDLQTGGSVQKLAFPETVSLLDIQM